MSSLLFVTITAFLLCIPHGSCWRRRRARPPPCPERSCEVSYWSSWSTCSKVCGNDGQQSRTRTKTVQEACGGGCYYDFTEHRSCNRYCMNGGTPDHSYCNCREGFTGRCCEYDKRSNEKNNLDKKDKSSNEKKHFEKKDNGTNDKNNFEQKGYHVSISVQVIGFGIGVLLGVVAIVIICSCVLFRGCRKIFCSCCNCCH